MAAEGSSNPLVALSAALAALVAAATPRAVGIRAKGAPPLSGTLWRPDVVVASEQVFPDVGEAEILHPDGAMSQARGRGGRRPCSAARAGARGRRGDPRGGGGGGGAWGRGWARAGTGAGGPRAAGRGAAGGRSARATSAASGAAKKTAGAHRARPG